MKQIRVLLTISTMGSGGVEKLARQWYQEAKKSNIEFMFVTHSMGGAAYDYFLNEKCKIFVLPTLEKSGVQKFVKQYIEVIKNNSIDILHVPCSRSAFLVLIASKICKIPCILHAHINYYEFDCGNFKSKVILKFLQISFGMLASYKLTASESAADYCYGFFRRKSVQLIKNGINIQNFAFDEDIRQNIRKELKINNAFVIGNIGRFTTQKNQIFIIEIFAEIVKKRSNSVLILLGEGEDEDKLKKYVNKLKISNKVLFLGTSENVSMYYQAMDVFLFPSLFEGLGIVAVEAQTAGLKTYISDKVPKEAIISDETEVISLDKDANYWANIIVTHPYNRNTNATNDAKNKGFDERESVMEVINIYKNLVK